MRNKVRLWMNVTGKRNSPSPAPDGERREGEKAGESWRNQGKRDRDEKG